MTLLERALAATQTAVEVVVVGEQVPTSRPVTWTREDPPGGGPAAGLLAALDWFVRPPDLVAVLAVDMPWVTPGTLARLLARLAAAPERDAAVLVDAGGRAQPLCAVYRLPALRAAAPEDPEARHHLPVRRLTERLALLEVEAVGQEASDIDTWDDLRAARERRRG